jgi:hypothetical protein
MCARKQSVPDHALGVEEFRGLGRVARAVRDTIYPFLHRFLENYGFADTTTVGSVSGRWNWQERKEYYVRSPASAR